MLISASIGLFFRLLLYDLVPKIEGIVKKASGIESICRFSTFELLSSYVIDQAARLIAPPKTVIGMPKPIARRVDDRLPRYRLSF